MIGPDQVQYFLTNSEDSICIISTSGELLYTNPAAERLFGISGEEGVKIWNAIPYVEGNDDLIQMFIDSIMNKDTSQEVIVDYWNTEGKVYNLHVKMTFFKQDPPVYLIVITDLTQLFKVNSALVRYTSPDIADYALMTAEGQKSGGVKKSVTILMSDLRGFTVLGSKLSAETLITVLNHYFEAMVAVIQKYGGTVIEFLGDGIFTVFGAPKDLPDHATRASKCAVEMQKALKQVNEWNKENGYPTLEMGIAINSGDAVVGNIGSEKKMKYGCMGATVNTTGRLEGLTVGGQVFISENTKKEIEEFVSVVSEGKFLPKGSPVELTYYEIDGVGEVHLDDDEKTTITWKEDEAVSDCLVYLIEGKTVVEEAFKGRMLKTSDNNRFALLESELVLAPKINIMIRKDDDVIYAKVIKQEESNYVVCFTAISKINI